MMQDVYLNASKRMQAVQTPIIPVIGDLIHANPGTISLAQGVVHYGPPASVFTKLAEMDDNVALHKYGQVEGIAPLISKIREKLSHENGISVHHDSRIVVTAGANMGFLNALFAVTEPGDEVILPLPSYFNHEMAIRMLDCQPVLVPTDENYQLCLDKLQDAITDKTRAIVTISPNNPAGVVYPESALRQVNELCRTQGLYHISDEAYEYFTYDGAKHFSAASMPTSQAHSISLYSLSKSYGFAGWRIGYMLIPEHLIGAIKKVQDTNLICPPLVCQYAALAALEEGSAYCRSKLPGIAAVREQLITPLQSINSLCQFPQSDGAFYLFLRIMADIDDMELVRTLITDHGVAVIPGNTFGMTTGCYIRVAYAALESDSAEHAINRLISGLRKIIST